MTYRLEFICPFCHTPLASPGKDNALHCEVHGFFRRSRKGFIRFLRDERSYFQQHWLDHQLPVIPDSKLTAARRFLEPLFGRVNPSGVWLDVGAGDGVHLQLITESAPSIDKVGIDISPMALTVCHRRVKDATLLLADAVSIPLADEMVDASFAYGVLGYLCDPWSGLAEMVRVTKRGGLVGLWFHPGGDGLLRFFFRLTRRIVLQLPEILRARIGDCIVPFLGLLPTSSGLSLRNGSWRACREVVLVNIAAPHLMFPTPQEVSENLVQLGCKVVFEDKKNPITLWAVRGQVACG